MFNCVTVYVARLLESVRANPIAIEERRRQARMKQQEEQRNNREDTWSLHPLEWMNEKHVAVYSAEGKNWYLEKWLKEMQSNSK